MVTGQPADSVIRDVERQMLMARPWDAAEEWSQWAITGVYPRGRGTFTDCLAVVLPAHAHGTDRTLFLFVGPMADDGPVDAAQVTHAVPLLLVLRADPGRAYWSEEQVWLRGSAA